MYAGTVRRKCRRVHHGEVVRNLPVLLFAEHVFYFFIKSSAGQRITDRDADFVRLEAFHDLKRGFDVGLRFAEVTELRK